LRHADLRPEAKGTDAEIDRLCPAPSDRIHLGERHAEHLARGQRMNVQTVAERLFQLGHVGDIRAEPSLHQIPTRVDLLGPLRVRQIKISSRRRCGYSIEQAHERGRAPVSPVLRLPQFFPAVSIGDGTAVVGVLVALSSRVRLNLLFCCSVRSSQ